MIGEIVDRSIHCLNPVDGLVIPSGKNIIIMDNSCDQSITNMFFLIDGV